MDSHHRLSPPKHVSSPSPHQILYMVRSFPISPAGMRSGLFGVGDGNPIPAKSSISVKVGNASNVIPLQICRRSQSSHPLSVFIGDDPLDFSFSLLLIEVVFVILVARILRFLFRPLKQPRVVTDLIGGIIVGPSVTGLHQAFFSRLFPDNAQFVLSNIGIIGFMFFLFVSGVKMDYSAIMKVGRKHIILGTLGFFLPAVAVCVVGTFFRSSLHGNLTRISKIVSFSANFSGTSFPVVYLILKELRLLSSEVGRMALATSLVSTAIWMVLVIVLGAVKQATFVSLEAMGMYIVSMAALLFFLIVIIPRFLFWIIDRTPEGKPISQGCVILIFMGVFFMGFWCDMLGLPVIHGSFWLGLAIPDGPPLGAAVVERSETFVMDFLMPFAFAFVGFRTNVFTMSHFGWSNLAPILSMALTQYISKLIVTVVVGLCLNIPLKDSLTLALIMNLKGETEMMIFAHWKRDKVLSIPTFSLMVLIITGMTALCTSLITSLYDPSSLYMVNKRRTIQHTPPDAELRVVICINDEESLAGLLHLLDISYPTLERPFTVFGVRLIELVGRAVPVFIDNDKAKEPIKHIDNDKIHHALQLYQETRDDCIKLRSFTIMSPQRTMYQDIREIAMENKATFILLHYSPKRLDNLAGTEIVRHAGGVQSINTDILSHSPCSVGILIEKRNAPNPILGRQSLCNSVYKYIVIFLGGADSREALAYADRMAMNPDVLLMAVRFLSSNSAGDDEMEKKLDDGVVTWFWVKNETNNRVIYREVVVENGQDTLEAIQSINDNSIDLWIVGRCQGINPILLQGLSRWDENLELGIIGDYISSDDFDSEGSVVVVHQQILRS